MAKANITTKDGAIIVIEGTADEVALLLLKFNSPAGASSDDATPTHKRRKAKSGAAKKANAPGRKKTTATTLVAELIENGSLKKPKDLSSIQSELKQGGNYFADAAIATALLRAVKARSLRRLDGEKGWTYVV